MKILAFLLLFSSSLFAKNLDYSYNQQNSIAWSWAEVISLIAENFSPYEIKRCELLSVYYADRNIVKHCCYAPQTCQTTNDLDEMTEVLRYRFQLAGQWRSNITFEKIKYNVDIGRPVIAHFVTQNKSRVTLIQGYESNGDLYLLDPMSDQSVKISYDTLKSQGYQGLSWFQTYSIGY